MKRSNQKAKSPITHHSIKLCIPQLSLVQPVGASSRQGDEEVVARGAALNDSRSVKLGGVRRLCGERLCVSAGD